MWPFRRPISLVGIRLRLPLIATPTPRRVTRPGPRSAPTGPRSRRNSSRARLKHFEQKRKRLSSSLVTSSLKRRSLSRFTIIQNHFWIRKSLVERGFVNLNIDCADKMMMMMTTTTTMRIRMSWQTHEEEEEEFVGVNFWVEIWIYLMMQGGKCVCGEQISIWGAF